LVLVKKKSKKEDGTEEQIEEEVPEQDFEQDSQEPDEASFIDEANAKPIRPMVNIIVWKVFVRDTLLVSKHVIRVISISC
jgi:hypothetical protein